MGTDRNSNRPPSQVLSESDRLVAANVALENAYDEARPQIMRWSVVTSALRDLMIARGQGRAHLGRDRPRRHSLGRGSTQQGILDGARGLFAPARTPDEADAWIERTAFERSASRSESCSFRLGSRKPFGQSPSSNLIAEDAVVGTSSASFARGRLVGGCDGRLPSGSALRARCGDLLAAQLPALLVPFVVSPEACFVHVPYALSLQGESLIKSLLLVAAAVVIAEGNATAEKARRA